MKKILLIIFLFCSFINVYASERSFKGSEYLEGLSYMKDNGVITQYRNAQVIRDTVTGEIAFCIEPFKLMVNNSYYTEDSYYSTVYGISEESWEKIKLYAYYGYGYKNHTDKNWISITQMSIWRALYPDYIFYYVDNVEDGNVIPLYNAEIGELNNLVNSHYTLPSFEKEYEYSTEKEIVLNDTNNVLNNYKIIKSDFDVSINNNSLIINTGNEEKEGEILIQRGGEVFPDSVKFFYSSQSQNVMERGNITPVNMELKITVKTGKIIVNKVDSETQNINSQGEASLDGSIFELLDENENVIKELQIENNTLEFDSLPFGKYYIKEKQPGTGYYLNQKKYEVVIDNDHLEQEITIDNEVIKSKVKIIKFYGTKKEYDENKMKREKDIVFVIYDNDGNSVFTGTTNSDGEIETMLPYGKYTLEQINTTSGYNKIEKYEFSINEDNSISYDIVLNDFKIEVPNASISLVKLLSNLLMELMYV